MGKAVWIKWHLLFWDEMVIPFWTIACASQQSAIVVCSGVCENYNYGILSLIESKTVLKQSRFVPVLSVFHLWYIYSLVQLGLLTFCLCFFNCQTLNFFMLNICYGLGLLWIWNCPLSVLGVSGCKMSSRADDSIEAGQTSRRGCVS